MTSKERFLAACEHRYPDRVPINYVATPDIDRRLREYYGAGSERDLLDRLGCDFYFLSVRDISQNETFYSIYRGPELPMTETERTCPFGIRYQRKVFKGKFAADEAIRGPLEGATSVQDVLKHTLPKPEWFDMDPLLEECEEFSDRVIIGGFWTAIFGNSYRMHGFSDFLLNMALRPEVIKTLINRMTDFYLSLNDRMFSRLKGKIDIWYIGNDYGTQHGLLFSRDMWLDFFSAATRRLADLAHSYGLKVMAHSCGGISEIIDPMIEAGVDILDPVQTTAVGMEPERLKERFGKRIVFHGAIDTQNVLPKGSPEEVESHARETIRVLGKDGGYIFASCNSIQGDTSPENIDGLYRAAREYSLP